MNSKSFGPHSFLKQLLTGIVIFLVLLGGSFLFFLVGADTNIDYYVVSETVTKGTSNGFQNEGAGDSQVNTKTEANNGTLTALMLPTGDVSLNWDYVKYTTPPCPVGLPPTHAGALTCPVPTASLEQDGNDTYITAKTVQTTDSNDVDRFDLLDPGLPTGSVISKIQAFAWARFNQSTGTQQISYDLGDPTGKCDPVGFGVGPSPSAYTMAFENRTSGAYWTLSCDGDAWATSDLANLDLYLTYAGDGGPGVSMYATVTYAGVVITFQTDYWMDISQTINVPSEQVSKVEVKLSCSLSGDTDTPTLQIAGNTVATGLCVGQYVDTSYDTGQRGDIVIRLYSNPDVTQTTYAIDLLIARVTKTEQGGSLKAPIPMCTHDALAHAFRCKDAQEYGSLNVQWIRWSIDGGQSKAGEPGGIVWLTDRDTGFGQVAHLIRAVAVYASGAEMEATVTVTADNTVWLVILIAVICVVIMIVAFGVETERQRKRKRRRAL